MTEKQYPGAVTKTSLWRPRSGLSGQTGGGWRPLPAVVLGHERYGLVQHTLDLAAKFARDGYVHCP